MAVWKRQAKRPHTAGLAQATEGFRDQPTLLLQYSDHTNEYIILSIIIVVCIFVLCYYCCSYVVSLLLFLRYYNMALPSPTQSLCLLSGCPPCTGQKLGGHLSRSPIQGALQEHGM